MQSHPNRDCRLSTRAGQGRAMIDLYYWTTPNGHKITMFLEETGLKYKVFPDQHRQGRAVQAGVSGDRAEQPHPRDGRSRAEGRRQADLDLRIRRDAALSRREDRQVPARRSLRPLRRDPVDVLADGRARADGRAEPPFPQLRRGKNQIRHRPLRERDQPALWRAQQAAGRSRIHRRRILDRRHGELSLDRAATRTRTRTSTTSRI